jgi:O-methyltransferase
MLMQWDSTIAARVPNGRSRLIQFNPEEMTADVGNAVGLNLPDWVPSGNSDEQPRRSLLRLFEGDYELGPEHATHEDIRCRGQGCYSHWDKQLLFSSSDNTSPKDNGRRYCVLVPNSMIAGSADSPLRLALTGQTEHLSDYQRYSLAREAFQRIWPNTRLPDMNRLIDIDPAFARDFKAHSERVDLTVERKFNLDQLCKIGYRVAGDVVECGTYTGNSAFFLARRIRELAPEKHLHLFDSFQGLSQPSKVDGNWWRSGDLHSSAEDVLSGLAPLGNLDFVHLYPGWIPERFDEVADRTTCFVHIDVDLYAPTMECVKFFYDRTSKGGILLLDDYGFSQCPGATAAIDEFMAGKPEPIVNLSAGGAFILKD